MEKYQKIVVTGFVCKEGKVLLVQRAAHETFLPDHYEMAGGKVDFGEDPAVSLVREYKEETQLSITVKEPFRTFSYLSDKGKRHTVEIVYLCQLQDPSQDISLSKDHSAYTWVGKEELDTLKISEQMKKSILLGFKLCSNSP